MTLDAPAAPLAVSPPIRRCVGGRHPAPKPALVRVVRSSATLVVDAEGTLPGRGAYVCGRRSCLEAALRGSGRPLRRALRADDDRVTVDAEAVAAAWERAVTR